MFTCCGITYEFYDLSRDEDVANALVVYPAQCNFSGYKYPLNWIQGIQHGQLSPITNSTDFFLDDAHRLLQDYRVQEVCSVFSYYQTLINIFQLQFLDPYYMWRDGCYNVRHTISSLKVHKPLSIYIKNCPLRFPLSTILEKFTRRYLTFWPILGFDTKISTKIGPCVGTAPCPIKIHVFAYRKM